MKTIISVICGALLVLGGVWYGSERDLSLGGIASNTCVATTTKWSIGPLEDKTVLSAKANRFSFVLSLQDVNTTAYYLLGTDNVGVDLGIGMAASTTVTYPETFPYRGAVKVMSLASTTLMVTECLY